jgi:hypothetical protein
VAGATFMVAGWRQRVGTLSWLPLEFEFLTTPTSGHGANIISLFDKLLSKRTFAFICANLPDSQKVIAVTVTTLTTRIANTT